MPIRSQLGISPLDFFLGNGENLNKKIPIAFRPDDGTKLRAKFEKKYGVRGERLVASFGGNSASPEENDFDRLADFEQLTDFNNKFLS